LPVISGPNVFNAQEIADMFVDKGACTIVQDAPGLAAAISTLIADPDAAKAMGERGRKIVLSNRGSLAKLLSLLEPLIGDS
jgi:3-deoxy-D-manno-octulosonic-acid transferase